MNDVVLKLEDVALFNRAEKFGLGGATLLQLLIQYGPAIVKLLLDILDKKPAALPDGTHVVGGLWDDAWGIRTLLGSLLKAHRDDIMKYLDEVENKLLDKLIEKLG